MNVDLSFEHKTALLKQLEKYKNVFAWTYAEMSKLDPQVVTYQLPIKQATMNFRTKLEV